MSIPVYIGDEVGASGYRLAGLRVRVPDASQLRATVSEACKDAPLVLLSTAIAQRLPADQLERLLAQVEPPVVLVPDMHGESRLENLAIRLRQQLGVLE